MTMKNRRMVAEESVLVECLPPLVDMKSRILILGTLPGPDSARKKEYYANKTNQFWPIMKRVYGVNDFLNHQRRTEVLLDQRISLWDALKCGRRKGSSDKHIQAPVLNDLFSFLQHHPNLKRVFFNGNPAKNYVKDLGPSLLGDPQFGFEVLPSSSLQNSHMSIEMKARHWKRTLNS